MPRKVTADTLNSALLSSKTLKSKSKQIFYPLGKFEKIGKWNEIVVSENSDLYPAFLVAVSRQALQLQLQLNDRIGSSSKLPGDSQIKYCCKKSYYRGKCL